jgi:5-formyltetrahydrofolate cyclo-ligase
VTSVNEPDPVRTVKREVRRRVLAARSDLSAATLTASAAAIAGNVAALVSDRRARTVCAYVSVGGEPGTQPLLDGLHGQGIRVLLPLLLDDLDLDWADYRPDESRLGRFGLREPTAPPLGVNAVQLADMVVCPGVAATPAGVRLGRGGGSYDRALARALPDSLRCVLLYDDEVLPDLPTEPHDQRIDVVVTPTRIVQTSRRRF